MMTRYNPTHRGGRQFTADCGVDLKGIRMFDAITKTLAAATFAVLPMATQAAVVTDLNVGGTYSISELLAKGTTSTVFTFTTTERLAIKGIYLGGFGDKAAKDLRGISYTLSDPAATGTLSVMAPPPRMTFSFGSAVTAGSTFKAGETFTLTFSASKPTANPLTVFATFDTAAVPVPAAGLMLLTALGAMMASRRRKMPA